MNILLTKERIKRAERLRLAQLAATKDGKLISYMSSVFEERESKLVKKLQPWISNKGEGYEGFTSTFY